MVPTVVVLRLQIGNGIIPLPHLPGTNWFHDLASAIVSDWFGTLDHWVASGTSWLLTEAWAAMSATTDPVLTGSSFTSEYHVMVLLGIGTLLPLLGLAVIQAIAHQDAGGLVRTALVRLPMAVLLTGVVVELVSLGLTVTDRASTALLAAGGDPTRRLLDHLASDLPNVFGSALGSFGAFLVLAVGAVIAFLLWLELAVRSAAVAVAATFLPLALAGLVWPATSHWARRLGETLAGLVLMKLVMAAVLALAAGALAAPAGGIASVVEAFALLGLTVFAPFVVFRLIPMVETGAASYIEGAGRRMASASAQTAADVWTFAGAGGAASPGAGGTAGGAAAAGGSATAAGAAQAGANLAANLPLAGDPIIDNQSGGGGSAGSSGGPPPAGAGPGGSAPGPPPAGAGPAGAPPGPPPAGGGHGAG